MKITEIWRRPRASVRIYCRCCQRIIKFPRGTLPGTASPSRHHDPPFGQSRITGSDSCERGVAGSDSISDDFIRTKKEKENRGERDSRTSESASRFEIHLHTLCPRSFIVYLDCLTVSGFICIPLRAATRETRLPMHRRPSQSV